MQEEIHRDTSPRTVCGHCVLRSGAMNPRGNGARVQRRHALREQRSCNAGQQIATATHRQRWISGSGHQRRHPGRSDHRRHTFQQYGSAEHRG